MKQTQSRQRILALPLALAMCLSLLPGVALAAENEPDLSSYVCEIWFNPNGGTAVKPANYEYFDKDWDGFTVETLLQSTNKLPVFPDAIRDGYTFDGWYTAQTGGTKVSSDTDLSLYDTGSSQVFLWAHWTQEPQQITNFEVRFYYNGGMLASSQGLEGFEGDYGGKFYQLLSDNAGIATTLPQVTRSEYTFDGWYTAETGGERITTTTVLNPYLGNAGAESRTDLVNLWAHWTKQPERGNMMMFYPNGGMVTEIDGHSRSQLLGDALSVTNLGVGIELTSKAGMVYADTSGKLPCFPTVTRDGYSFDGWYVVPANQIPQSADMNAEPEFMTEFGSYPKASLSTAYTQYTNFVAKWTKAVDTYTVTFNLNGGSGTTPEPLKVPKDGAITLPEKDPTRSGYVFQGWFSGTIKGNELTDAVQWRNGDKVTEDVTLYAVWTTGDCTIRFQLNGAPGTMQSIKVAKGSAPVLPDAPTWSGHTFLYWMSGDVDNGILKNARIWVDGDTVTEDITLYAFWSGIPTDETLNGLTYYFPNSSGSFRYDENYQIPLERYQLMFGETTRATELYNSRGTWGGSCFGMSSTSVMFFEGNVSTGSYRSGAKVPFDLHPTDASSQFTLTEFIEAMQVAQNTPIGSQATWRNKDKIDDLFNAVKKGPVVVSMLHNVTYGGHAVVAYDVVESSTETRLMIYDPNFPNTERYIPFTKTVKGGNAIYSWHYLMNDSIDYGTEYNYFISYISASDINRIWAGRQSSTSANTDAMNFLSLKTSNATITDSAGNTVATVKNGEITVVSSEVFPLLNIAPTSDGETAANSSTAMWLPTGTYTVSNTGTGTLGVTMVNVDQSATVSTAASSVTFLVDDSKATNSVQVDGAGKSYDITLSSTLDQGYKEVTLTGTTSAETTAVAQISGKLYGTNLDTKGTLKVDGKSSDSSVLAGTVPNVSTTQPTKPTGTNPFTDVASSAYYYDAVLWAVENGVTSGTSATTFSPNDPCTRAQIVTFLWRASGSPKSTTTTNPFKDVQAGAYYYDAVLWAVEKGITSGTSADTFSPNDSCTRAQTVTFLWRSAGSPKPAASSNPFTDVQSGTYYYDAVLWAVENSITSGTGANTFSPADTVTRGQTVTFLYRSQGK